MMISIVIASFNQNAYLPKAIESALCQTFWGKEVIVVDDGSTDGSLETANWYRKETLVGYRVISQVNKGLPSARNTGLMHAKGDWLLFLDADDVLYDTCLQRIFEVAKNNPQADVIAPSFKTFGLAYEPVILMPNPSLQDFKAGNRLGYCAAIRKSALLEVGGYSPRMAYGYEDLHLWINLLIRGKKIITLPDILWQYRLKENSMIHEAKAHHEELMQQIKKDFPQAQLNF